jgi:hypothetical protein
MGKDTSKTPASLLAEALQNLEKQEEDVVLPDECGDTLWDKVLEQEEKKDADAKKNNG